MLEIEEITPPPKRMGPEEAKGKPVVPARLSDLIPDANRLGRPIDPDAEVEQKDQ